MILSIRCFPGLGVMTVTPEKLTELSSSYDFSTLLPFPLFDCGEFDTLLVSYSFLGLAFSVDL